MGKLAIPEDDLVSILSNYRLGKFEAARPLTGGTVQTNLLVETTTGKVVFRLYNSRSINSVRFEAGLIRFLRAHNYPCPAIFKNKQGKFVGIYDESPYAFFEFIEGQVIENPTGVQKTQLIEKVAELHNLTKNYRPTLAKYRWNYSPALCRELAGKAAEKLNTADGWAKLAWLEATLAELQLPVSLPKGICHADFHFSNILFKDGQFAALLDFDDANLTYLLYDLVGLVESEAWRYDFDRTVNFRIARQVVSAYAKHRPVNALEKRHLFDVYKLSILIDCVWYFPRGTFPDFYEKRKIDFLNEVDRDSFYDQIF